jgi:predicted nucleotidyltransferase component of viral defense system
MITRQQLTIINRQTLRYPLHVAEKDYQSPATIKIEKLQYTGPLSQPNSLKVEIDYLQNVVLPPRLLTYQNVWGVDFEVPVMDVREICAEKLRAMSDRARYRDFYDLFLLLEKLSPNIQEVTELMKNKEIRQPISTKKILANWQVIQSQQAKTKRSIYYSQPVTDKQLERMIAELPTITIEPVN